MTAPTCETISLVVSPVAGRPGIYRVTVDGLTPLELPASRRPFLDSARKLIALGYDPTCRIVMRNAGEAFDALSATLGRAAKLTVRETESHGPRFAPWVAFSRDNVPAVGALAA